MMQRPTRYVNLFGPVLPKGAQNEIEIISPCKKCGACLTVIDHEEDDIDLDPECYSCEVGKSSRSTLFDDQKQLIDDHIKMICEKLPDI